MENDAEVSTHTHTHQHKGTEEMNYPYPVASGFPSNDGFGLGGGLIGGLLLGSLLRNGSGFLGNNGYNEGFSSNGVNAVTNAVDTNAILTTLGDIKAAVPLSEAQVQLALAGAVADITSQNLQQTIGLQTQAYQGQIATQQGFAATGDKIDAFAQAQSVANGLINQTIMQGNFAVTSAIKDDGEKTRALITANQIAELNRIAQERQDEIVELRNESRLADHRRGIEINMINNQNQNQMQFQQQAQVLGSLCHALNDVGQIARATNQSLIIGNTGAVTSGPQTANPTNVRA